MNNTCASKFVLFKIYFNYNNRFFSLKSGNNKGPGTLVMAGHCMNATLVLYLIYIKLS